MKNKFLKLMALFVASAFVGNAGAQTDVTSTYLNNADFELSPIFDGTSLGSDKSTNATPTEGAELVEGASNAYKIEGWTTMTTETSDFARTFTMPYNVTMYVKSNGANGGQAVTSPVNSSTITEDNNSLFFAEANWCQNAILGVKQTVSLPIGVYKLTFDTYVSTTTANASSLCGIKIGETSTYKWPTAVNTWTNNEIYFALSAESEVEISMGYKKLGNKGGGESPFLFVDNLKLEQIKETAPATSPINVTDKIVNANANNAWGAPWAHEGDLQDNVNMNVGYDGVKGFFEPSKWGSNTWGGTMYTDLTGLANGLYTLKAAVQSETGVHTRLIAGSSNSAEFPANGTTKGTIKADGSVVTEGDGVAGWNFGSTTVWVTDGKLRIGVYSAAWEQKRWTNIDNFTLSYIPASEFINYENPATNEDYAALEEAIANAEGHTIGFLKGEYAPYNNREVLTALAAAKAINTAANNDKEEVLNTIAAISNGKWLANELEVNAIYNGNFANSTPNANSGVDVDVPGWTWVTGMRMIVADKDTDPSLSQTDAGKALFAWGGTDCVYGETDGYTMPLAAHTIYEFSFKFAGWRDGDMGYVTVSILNQNGESITSNNTPNATRRINTEDAFSTHTVRFKTGEAGNYTLKLWTSKHTAFTDVKLYTAKTVDFEFKVDWGTLILPFAAEKPEGMEVYTCETENNGTLELVAVDKIEANTPYIVEKTGETTAFTFDTEIISYTEATHTSGMLTGTFESTAAPVGSYVLQKQNEVLGFYKVADGKQPTVGAYRCYINASESAAPMFSLERGEGTTSIEEAELTIDNAVIYDLAGRRVEKMEKGIYIVNGKKVIR